MLDGVWQWLLQTTNGLVASYGIIGVFIASVLANATLFFPVPMNVIDYGLGALAHENGWGLGFVLLVGIASGLGAAIGELTGYFAGFAGGKALEGWMKKLDAAKVDAAKEKINRLGSWVVFVAAVLPSPFDIVGIAAGVAKFDVKRFFIATAAGKIIRDVLITAAGFYSVEIIRTVFGLF